jgi:hypothetical protein
MKVLLAFEKTCELAVQRVISLQLDGGTVRWLAEHSILGLGVQMGWNVIHGLFLHPEQSGHPFIESFLSEGLTLGQESLVIRESSDYLLPVIHYFSFQPTNRSDKPGFVQHLTRNFYVSVCLAAIAVHEHHIRHLTANSTFIITEASFRKASWTRHGVIGNQMLTCRTVSVLPRLDVVVNLDH